MADAAVRAVTDVHISCRTGNLIIIVRFFAKDVKVNISDTAVNFQIMHIQFWYFYISGADFNRDIVSYADLPCICKLACSYRHIQVICSKIITHRNSTCCNLYGSVLKPQVLRITHSDLTFLCPAKWLDDQAVIVCTDPYFVFLRTGHFYTDLVSVTALKLKCISTQGKIQIRYRIDLKDFFVILCRDRLKLCDLIPVFVPGIMALL